MDQINDVLGRMKPTSLKTQNLERNTSESFLNAVVNKTFYDLQTIYTGWRASFKAQVEIDEYKRNLLLALMDKDVSELSMIEQGLKKAAVDSELRDFLPPPHRFASWCRPNIKDLGLMSPSQAYTHASEETGKHPSARKWKDQVVRQAVGDIGYQRIKSEPRNSVFYDFKSRYEELCLDYAAGKRFEFPNEDIKLLPEKPLSKEENIEMLEKLRKECEI